ncbi:MAG: precorrin-4 C(11)-methyltransferase [Oscillospiraceae bacterium]|nr:precorrin-4 C(11)-methyltransferase [Oscillospiraceae bacterium]
MIHFVGAGAGAEDLITVRGAELMRQTDTVIYAGSLVNPALLSLCRDGCDVYNSAEMTLEQVLSVMEQCHKEGKDLVRLHTGDPSIYGAVQEQIDALIERDIPWDWTPGVSSFCAAAAAAGREYTLPGVSQTVILTRAEGRTPVPDGQKISDLAVHGASMVIFLSAGLLEKVQQELLEGAYDAETPAALVYKASWPQERVIRCPLGRLAETGYVNEITDTALVLVGDFLQSGYHRSSLYDPGFTTGFREADP